MNLDARTLGVANTAAVGVVSAETRLTFIQRGDRVVGRYAGGSISRGVLAGRVSGDRLTFRYVQRERDGRIHAGRSTCQLVEDGNGRLTMLEHFTWTSRQGAGTNTFLEVDHHRSI